MPCKGQLQLFNGNQPHATLPIVGKGERYSLIFFSTSGHDRLTSFWKRGVGVYTRSFASRSNHPSLARASEEGEMTFLQNSYLEFPV